VGDSLVSRFKTFGKFGPVYEILSIPAGDNDVPTATIRVLETGEMLKYSLDSIALDPEAA